MASNTDPHTVDHSYHLVEPSPWPLIASLGALLLFFGLVMAFHAISIGDIQIGPALCALGGGIILYTMYVWWRDVIAEAHGGFHTPVVQLHLRYGMILFIISEVMFFVAWFWAFFEASLRVDSPELVGRIAATGGVWPPEGIHPFDPYGLPLVNTIILLLSGTTVTWAHHALLKNDRRHLIYGLVCTVALGALFLLLQAYEYTHAAFPFSGNIYGATFFMATGFHGLHVFIGVAFLAVCLGRALKGHFGPERHIGFEAAAWYWHFVDVVWLFLFIWIYIWSTGWSYTVAAH